MITNEKNVELCEDNTKWQVRAGMIMMCAAILVLFIQNTYGALATFFVIVGCIEFYLGKKKLRKIKKFYKYKELIGEKAIIRLSDLATGVQEDKLEVISDLDWMIQNAFFEDVEIDSKKEFFRSRSHYEQKVNSISINEKVIIEQSEELIEKQRKTFYKSKEEDTYYAEVCDCCGGTTRIKVGGGGVCDYCHAPIGKYKR